MPKVVVGVPVYNGGEQLRECLDCLLDQTLKDIEIRIYDNASQDNTKEISEEYVKKDSRIKYIRHPENIRAMPNFLSVLRDCETEFVMWRAHDDLCSPDYVEGLYRALIANPKANVAVATTRTISRNKEVSVSTPRAFDRKPAIPAVIQLMFNSHAGWFYGLWRRDALLADFQDCWAAFPHPWALDHLILFPSLLKRAVAIVPDVSFIQRLVTKTYTPQKGTKPPVEQMMTLRRLFAAQCRHYINHSAFSSMQKAILRAVLPFYVDRRVYKLRKIVKRVVFRDKTAPAYGSDF